MIRVANRSTTLAVVSLLVGGCLTSSTDGTEDATSLDKAQACATADGRHTAEGITRDVEVYSRGNDDLAELYMMVGINEAIVGRQTTPLDPEQYIALGRAVRPELTLANNYETALLSADLNAALAGDVKLTFAAQLTSCDIMAISAMQAYKLRLWTRDGAPQTAAVALELSRVPGNDPNAARAGAGANPDRSAYNAVLGAIMPVSDLGVGTHQLEWRICGGDDDEACTTPSVNNDGIVVSYHGLQAIIYGTIEIGERPTASGGTERYTIAANVTMEGAPFRRELPYQLVSRTIYRDAKTAVCTEVAGNGLPNTRYEPTPSWSAKLGLHPDAFFLVKRSVNACY